MVTTTWRYVYRKTALLKCVSFTAYKDISSHNFWATRLILVLKEVEWSALQKYRDLFSVFELKKLQRPEVEIIYKKKTISSWKHVLTWELNSSTKKKFLNICWANNSSSVDMFIDFVGRTVIPLFYVPRA